MGTTLAIEASTGRPAEKRHAAANQLRGDKAIAIGVLFPIGGYVVGDRRMPVERAFLQLDSERVACHPLDERLIYPGQVCWVVEKLPPAGHDEPAAERRTAWVDSAAGRVRHL